MPDQSNIDLNSSVASTPTSYRVDHIFVTNHSGEQYDVKNLVTSFSITESIYTPTLTLSMSIKDPINMLEEFKFTGQEIVDIELSRTPFDSQDAETIRHKFYVTEYPVYGKFNNRLQVYSIRGISKHAYLSKLKQISKSYSANIGDIVSSILTEDLGCPEDSIVKSKSPTANMSLIVPYMEPLEAVSWLLRRMYSGDGSPFYCFETLDGKIRIASQGEMVKAESVGEYLDAMFFNDQAQTKEEYEAQSKRILSIASDLKMSKFLAAASGAYSSSTTYVDLSTKSISSATYSYDGKDGFKSMSVIDQGKVLSEKFYPEANYHLSDYPLSSVNMISLNSMSFPGKVSYHSATGSGSINKAKAYVENLDSITHDLVLAGDFKLQSGTVISLQLPRAIGPEVDVRNSKSPNNRGEDVFLSGKYLVTAVVHNFADDYTCETRVKRDSFPAAYLE